jgi:hypothetical protein
LQLFTSLPLEKLDRLKIAALTSEIGNKEANLHGFSQTTSSE